MSSKVAPATLAFSALLAGGLALSVAFASSPSEASDNCKRLPSASLIILVPEGGCDVTDPDKQPKMPGDVTVIRGGIPMIGLDKKATGSVTRSAAPGGPLVIVIRDL
jgi:hypothetical protein